MRRDPVESSNIASIGYDPTQQTLEIEFKGNGAVHQYKGVPQDLADKFVRAPSVGRFFHQFIKGTFPEERVSA